MILDNVNDLQVRPATSAMMRVAQKRKVSRSSSHDIRASRQAFRVEDVISVISDNVNDLRGRPATSAMKRIERKNQFSPSSSHDVRASRQAFRVEDHSTVVIAEDYKDIPSTVICETTNDLQGYLSTSAMKRIEQKHQPSSAFNHLRASRQAFRIEDMISVISDKVKDLEDRMSTSATQQIDEKHQSSPTFNHGLNLSRQAFRDQDCSAFPSKEQPPMSKQLPVVQTGITKGLAAWAPNVDTKYDTMPLIGLGIGAVVSAMISSR